MDSKRLEELARVCDIALADNDATHLLADEIADLARCARGWAKVERAKHKTGNHTWMIVSDRHGFTLDTAWTGEHDPHLTALEAVEAAEVGK